MEKYYYLLINFFSILIPFLLSFDNKIRFYKEWKFLLPALMLGGIVFLIWDHYFVIHQVWSFNPNYITGIYIAELPVEEILFFLTIPYACVFVYANFKIRFPHINNHNFSKYVLVILLIFSVVIVILFYNCIYTLITFTLLIILCIYFLKKERIYLNTFFISYVVCLIPFAIVNGLLTSIPIVLYNNMENVDFRWGTIPFEDSFYMLALLLLDVELFEQFKKRFLARS